MNENITELVMLIDRSSSLRHRENEAYETYLNTLDGFRKSSERCLFTLGLFSDSLKVCFLQSELSETMNIPQRELYSYGNTALYDSVVSILESADRGMRHVRSDCNINRHLIVITDGRDNASIFTDKKILMTELAARRLRGWEILFMKSNGTRLSVIEQA